MLPARFLRPWEALEMDIHGMGETSRTGNKHLLVIVDKTSKLLFAYPLLAKTALKVTEESPNLNPDVRSILFAT